MVYLCFSFEDDCRCSFYMFFFYMFFVLICLYMQSMYVCIYIYMFLFDPCGFLWRFNERKLAEMEAEKIDPVYQSRASRLDKWRALVADAQKELQLAPSPPERLMPHV